MGVFFIAVGAIASGVAVPLVKYSTQISVTEFASARAGFTLLLLSLFFGRHVVRELSGASRTEVLGLIKYGVAFTGAVLLSYVMFRLWTVSMAMSIVGLIPLFGIVYGRLKGRRIARKTMLTAGVLVASTMVALLFMQEQKEAPHPWIGLTLAILCDILYIAQAEFVKTTERISWQSRVAVFASILLVSSILAAIIFQEPLYGSLALTDTHVLIPLVGVGLFAGFFYFMSVNISTHHLRVEEAVTLQMIELPLWLVIGTFGYGEHLVPVQWVALVSAAVATMALSYLSAKSSQGDN